MRRVDVESAAAPAAPSSPRRHAAVNPNLYDLSGHSELAPVDRQRVMAYVQQGQASGASALTKLEAHEKLSEFYRKGGDLRRAQDENQRAVYWKNGGHW